MRTYATAALLAFGLSLPICVKAQSGADSATAEVRRTTFAQSLRVDLDHSRQTWSGTFVRDLVQGSESTQRYLHGIQIQLRMWLADGTPVLDPSPDSLSILKPTLRRSSDTVAFDVGRGMVIRGLDEGVRGMRPGGVRQLVIPSSAGFGRDGRLNVPPNSVLVAEVKLLVATPQDTLRIVR